MAAIGDRLHAVLTRAWDSVQSVMRNEKRDDFEGILKEDWGIYEIDREEYGVIARFMWMQRLDHWWHDMVAEYAPKLSKILFDNPMLYFGLQEAGYHVSLWVRGHPLDYIGAAEAELRELHRQDAVAEYWNAHA